ncbi:MAG: SPFH domain-containing protein [Cyanobacteriota bacterium]
MLITGRPEIIEIKDNQIGVLEEKGQFKKLCQQNTYKVYPHQRLHIIETGEQKIDLKHKILRSYDNIDIDTEGYYTYIITEPVKAFYEVANLKEAIKIIVIKHILDTFEDFETTQLKDSLGTINKTITNSLENEPLFLEWGVKINQIEITNITL